MALGYQLAKTPFLTPVRRLKLLKGEIEEGFVKNHSVYVTLCYMKQLHEIVKLNSV